MPDALPPNTQPAPEEDTVPINVNLTLNLPRAQVAELGRQLTEAAQPPHPLQFATVDKVELVGIVPSQNTAADQTLWKNLTPLAQQLVQSVEEAHNAIDSAVKMAAQQQAAQAPQQKAMPVQANPPMQLLNVPQPFLTRVTQVQPSCGCAQAM